jgi:pimeloyl-ACP methyl ester carboxylesterase
MGAQVALRALELGLMSPSRLILMPNPLHRAAPRERWRTVARVGAVPGLDRALTHVARAAFRPEHGVKLTASADPAARDLVRHAFADVGGDATRARAWARAARRWPTGAQSDLLDAYEHIDVPTLLLWADEDRLHPLSIAEEALGLLPDAHLRVLPGTGFLLAYDDPVGLARELAAFCM